MNPKHLFTALVAAAVLTPLVAGAQSTYTLTNGEVNLVAGLTNLTSITAIGTTNQSVGINYITDSSWSATGIANLGSVGGTLAGTFGGANYFASSNNVILIGSGNSLGGPAWGGWTVRMLLSDDTYSSNSINYTNSNLVNNTNPAARLVTNNSFFLNNNGTTVTSTNALFNTYYQLLNIADFDTLNIGVKGIELSSMTPQFPDISYIGVTAVPEPSTYALLALSAAGLGGYVLRRRRK
jgi:hypothetical protein